MHITIKEVVPWICLGALLLALALFLISSIMMVFLEHEQDRRWRDEKRLQRLQANSTKGLVPTRRTFGFGPTDEEFDLPRLQEAIRLDALREAPGSGSEPDWTRHDPPIV